MAEISDEQLATLQRAHKLLDTLWNDKDQGTAFKKMVKAKMPDVSIPEVDVAERLQKDSDEKYTKVEAQNKALQDRLDKWESSQKDKEEEGTLKKRIDAVQKEYGWTEEGMEKVIKRMREQNSADVESAAAWVDKHNPKAKPTTNSTPAYMPEKMNLYGTGEKDERWADLNKSPERYFDKEVTNIMNNPENYREFGGEQ